jgi:hypothetical protein
MLRVPFTEITSSREVKTKRVCVAADGIDQCGRCGDGFLPKTLKPHVAKRTSIGGNSRAGIRYQITPS